MRERADAEDIAAEVFIIALRKLTAKDRPLPWLYATAHNLIRQYYRASGRRHRAEQPLGDQDVAIVEGIDQAERLAVADAVAHLRGREHEVILLTYWEQLDARDIATVLGCSAASVWTALSRARARLRDSLSEQIPVKAGERNG